MHILPALLLGRKNTHKKLFLPPLGEKNSLHKINLSVFFKPLCADLNKRRTMPLFAYRISRVELIVSALCVDKLIVRSALDYPSMLEYYNAVGIAHR